jgi:hypothetical protein
VGASCLCRVMELCVFFVDLCFMFVKMVSFVTKVRNSKEKALVSLSKEI